ncbi:hypothetical protein FKM82_023888, partial [Ascaphus truei]
ILGLVVLISLALDLQCILGLVVLISLSYFPGLQSKLKNTKQNKKPAAHFEGDPYTHGSLLWRSDTANTFARGGLTLRNNTLHVASAGLYFVYTQASFLGRGCPRTGGPVSLSHGVALLSDQYPQEMPLLSTGKTACRELAGQTSRPPAAKPGPDPADRTWARAIFQGGTFALEEGDVLHTVTEGGEYLRLGPGEAFFGAYAL